MIFLYIILYLVVGLIYKWRIEKLFQHELDFDHATIAILLWPTFVAVGICYVMINYLSYKRIRKFFRWF